MVSTAAAPSLAPAFSSQWWASLSLHSPPSFHYYRAGYKLDGPTIIHKQASSALYNDNSTLRYPSHIPNPIHLKEEITP